MVMEFVKEDNIKGKIFEFIYDGAVHDVILQ